MGGITMAVMNDKKSLKQVITVLDHKDLYNVMNNLLPTTMGQHDTISRRKSINRAVTSLRKATLRFDTQK
jgi:hypothetical protein